MKKFIKRIYHKIKLAFTRSDAPTRDIVLGKVWLGAPKWAEVGNKVICDRGIAHIKEIKKNDWLLLTYGYKQKVEKKLSSVFQFVVDIKDPYSGKKYTLPLSFSDYEYIDQNELGKRVQINVTKRKYAKLTEREREGRKYLYHFNQTQGGTVVLKKLHDDGLIVLEGDLLTIKKK